RNAANVVRIARTFEAVNDDEDRRVLGLARLPVAMSKQARFWVDLKEPGFSGRDIEPPGNKSRHDGHGVTVSEERIRFEGREDEVHTETLFHGAGASKTKGSGFGL
ncbi:MAG: hypothetical protein DMG55_32920, partial [Acidobacteria bacterium]